MRRRAGILVYVILWLLIVLPIGFFPALLLGSAKTESEISKLYRIFKIKNVSANYIIVIDTSLSMAPVFDEVKDALGGLTQSLKAGDTISIISFDNRPKLIYQGRIGRSKWAVFSKLPDSPNPDGQRTDIGAAIEAVLRQTERSKSDLQFVFFLTDGRDEPPDASKFEREAEASWVKLKEQAAASKKKVLRVHGIGLNANTDINLLRQVFPDSDQITISPPELKSYFIELKDRIREERLKVQLNRELRSGRVTIEPVGGEEWGEIRSKGEIIRRYRVTSTYRHLPVIVDLKPPRLKSVIDKETGGSRRDDFKVELVGPSRFELKPRTSRLMKVRLKAPELPRVLKIGRSPIYYDGEIQLNLSANLRPSAGLTALGFNSEASLANGRQRFTFYHLVGQAFSTIAVLGLAALLIAAVLTRIVFMPAGRLISRLISPPPLTGRLAFSQAPMGHNLPPPVSLSQYGKRAVIGSSGNIGLSGGSVVDRHAEIFTRWEKSKPAVFIRKLDGEVRIAASSRGAGHLIFDEAELKRGNIIELGGYKIQWI